MLPRGAWGPIGLLLAVAMVALSIPLSAAQAPTPPVDGISPAQEPPDLYATPPSARSTNETAPVEICTDVINFGPGPSVRSFSVRLHLDGFDAGAKLVTRTLQSGEQETVCWTARLAAGDHTAYAAVDVGEEVAESNESNNKSPVSRFHVARKPAPDLVITTIQASRVRLDEPIYFTIRILNRGEEPSGASDIVFGDRLGQILREPIPGLPPSGYHTAVAVLWPDQRPPGAFIAQATVDASGAVMEHNETNNVAFHQYTIPARPLPQLRLDDVTVGALDRITGRVQLNVTMSNVGAANASHFVVRIDRNGTPTNFSASLRANATTNQTFALSVPPGNWTLNVSLDPDGLVYESNETDNWANVTVSVDERAIPRPLPNLHVHQVHAAPNDPGPGEAVHVNAFVGNNGEIRANASTVTCLVDGVPFANVSIGTVTPGEFKPASCTWSPPRAGTFVLRVAVDVAEKVEEIVEADNDRVVLFRVAPPAPPPPPPEEPPTNETGGNETAPPPLVVPTPEATNRTTPIVVIGEMSVSTRPGPDGVMGVVTANIRNPMLSPTGRLSMTFRVDGTQVKETLHNGLVSAGTASISSGEIVLPAGKHEVTLEIRGLDRTSGADRTAAIARRDYEEVLPEAGIPGPPAPLVLALLGLAALAARRRAR